LEGVAQKCPDEVWTIPMRTNFKINDLEFNGSRISMIEHEKLDYITSMKTNLNLRPTINWTSLMVEQDSSDLKYQTPILHHVITNYWTSLICINIIFLLIIIFGIYYAYKRNGNRIITVNARPDEIELNEM